MAEEHLQRRLAAILSADVVGYSHLMGRDEAGTLARLKSLRREIIDPTVAAHAGRTVKLMGDGTLIEFASAVDAVACAVELQKRIAESNAGGPEGDRIEFRIGINVGDIIVDGDDIYGDGVNVAARIEGIAEAGDVCLSNAAYEQVRDKIGAEFTDLGDKQLKNIARPVRVFAIRVGGASKTPNPKVAQASVLASSAPRLSIIVLPFANMGGDPEQEYFVDGVTESLTTDLSRISGSFVIARNTAFTYKGKHIDVKQIGRELNVRYVLEGSVQRGGNRFRVNVQLIDAGSGNHLWAERFDKPVADLFDMQDEIVARLANQLGTQLVAAEARRAERAPNPDSMDLYFQGMACVHKGPTPEHLAQARCYFERALALASDNVEALAGKALVERMVGGNLMTDDRAVRLAAAEAAALKALSLAPNHAVARYALGIIYCYTNRPAQAMTEAEHALVSDRNLAPAHWIIGFAMNALGRGAECEAHILDALRLSPRDINAYDWMYSGGWAKLCIGSDEEAAVWFRRSIEANRNYSMAQFLLASALAHLHRLDEARAAVGAGLALDPNFTIRRLQVGAPSDNPTFLAQRERALDGLRMAGVPER